MKKIVITGANGFLGSHLCRTAYRAGYAVKAFVRHTADLTNIKDIPCEIFYGDLVQKEDIKKALHGCSIVIHAASVTKQWNVSFEEYEKINFTTTKLIVQVALEQKIEKFIYISTANTLAPGSKQYPGTELNSFGLAYLNSGYINSKYLAQQYILEQVLTQNLPAIVVNPTFMVGGNDYKPSSGQLLLYSMYKRIVFSPPGGKNFVHIQDVCHGILSAVTKGKNGDCYLIAGENLTYEEFFKSRQSKTDCKQTIITIPSFILKLTGLAGSLVESITGKSRKLNYTTARLLCINNYYSGKKAERELGIKYSPISDAIEEAVSWFKENKYISQ